MSEGKSTNLLKTAKELNIGLSTAVEFLGKKGFKVEARPNTKLTDEMYDVLLKEYQGDKIVKEEAKQIVIGKIRRDDAPLSTEKTDLQPSKEFEQEEILIKNVNSFTPPAVEKPKEVAPVAPKPEEGALPGVKVIGKIDLNQLNSKTRPDKKSPEPAKPAEAPVPKPEPIAETPVKVEPLVEKPKQADITPPAKVEAAPKAESAEAPKAPEKVEPVVASPVESASSVPPVQEKQENE
jgi:translation initiation factor IF-2